MLEKEETVEMFLENQGEILMTFDHPKHDLNQQ